MHLIIIHNDIDSSDNTDRSLSRVIESSGNLTGIILKGLTNSCRFNGIRNMMFAIRRQPDSAHLVKNHKVILYDKDLTIPINTSSSQTTNRHVISNGRFACHINHQWLNAILSQKIKSQASTIERYSQAEVLFINVDSELLSYQEKVRLTHNNEIVGFRRIYSDILLPDAMPNNWPHHIIIKENALKKILSNGNLPADFSEFLARCQSNSLGCHSIKIAGTVIDLQTENGLLTFVTNHLTSNRYTNNGYGKTVEYMANAKSCQIADSARLFGKIVLGKNVKIKKDAIVVGPVILDDNSVIQSKAVVKSSVIGPGISTPKEKSNFIK